MKKINFNIDREFKLYAFRQIIFIILITLFFFGLFYYNFGLILASFMLWVFLVFGVLFLYLDIKFIYKFQQQDEEIENLKYVVRNIK